MVADGRWEEGRTQKKVVVRLNDDAERWSRVAGMRREPAIGMHEVLSRLGNSGLASLRVNCGRLWGGGSGPTCVGSGAHGPSKTSPFDQKASLNTSLVAKKLKLMIINGLHD